MIKRVLHIIVSAWLSILLLFGSTTMEFVHSFTGHEDTIDVQQKHQGPAIESKHHHCSFLGFALAPFANDSELPRVFFSFPKHFSIYNAAYNAYKLQAYTAQTLLRGPPAIA